MPISPLSPLVIPPTQATPAADWPDDADAFVTDQYRWTMEFNSTTIPAMNAAVSQVNDDALSAASSASDAADSAQEAADVAAGVDDAVANAEAAAAAAQAAAGLPALTGNRRKPLAVSDDETMATFRDELSLAKFIDRQTVVSAATGTVNLDLSASSVFQLTLTGNTTLTVSNSPTMVGETYAIVVRIVQGATARTLNWFAGITWLNANGVPATPAANKTIEYILSWNGTNWIGRRGAGN